MCFVLELKVQTNLLLDIFRLSTNSVSRGRYAAAIDFLSMDHSFNTHVGYITLEGMWDSTYTVSSGRSMRISMSRHAILVVY